MNDDDRINRDNEDRDGESADEPMPATPSEEPEADELQRKIDEIERKVADGN
ncbi:hypothetical protein T3H00_26595 [Pseudomonas fluorescens]|jgi:hypothetical protein|uniref:hypothetical protein n=1 Tax=Pseudomonas TaxID=286 RepID=UPI001A928212|nr:MULTISPECIES: hypothetical protein [Pseudomonas]MDZ5436222.1 hypothetical protein [Pseudomonas fluorescens]